MDTVCLERTIKHFGTNMLSIINFFSAKARLKESKKTIDMMGGEDECQPMVLAQRDYLELEVEYYRKKSVINGVILLTLSIIAVIIYYYIY